MTIASPVKLKTATPIPLVAPRMARIAEIQQVAIPKAEEGPVRRVVLGNVLDVLRCGNRKARRTLTWPYVGTHEVDGR